MAAIATPNYARMNSRVLIVSPDPGFRRQLLSNPLYAEVQGEEAVGGAHALSKLAEGLYENVLLDRHLPDLEAGEVAAMIHSRFPQVDVEIVDSAAAKADVVPFVEKNAREERRIARLHAGPPEKCEEFGAGVSPMADALPGMIGTSRGVQQVYRLARMVAPRDTTVLITGETGTGKELVAQAIHALSHRSKQPFVVVNCAAIPESLLESELFGHARGAFTGAVQSRLGRIHVAHGGTLFLDEIGELPLSMQAKLLRFLQDGEVQRLGSSDVYKVDVRVVCATNAKLLDLVHEKRFRMDLFYRLSVFPIRILPLRERSADIPLLAEHFLGKLCEETEVPPKYLADSAQNQLQQYSWPGNVRELQHAMERAFILAGAEAQLTGEHFQSSQEDGLREI